MKNVSGKFRFVRTFLILYLLLVSNTFGQNGIPLLLFSGKAAEDISQTEFQDMKTMGADAVIVNDLGATSLNNIKEANLKVIAAQIWVPNNQVSSYTDARYSLWKADGSGAGSVQLQHTNCTTRDVSSIITNTNAPAGDVLWGPYYVQTVYYQNTNTLIEYNVKFKLRLEKIPGVDYNNSAVKNTELCQVRAQYGLLAANKSPIQPLEILGSSSIKIGDFNSDGTQEQIINYTYAGKPVNSTESIKSVSAAYEVSFAVWFSGTSLGRLIIDEIEVYDVKGHDLKYNNQTAQSDILTQLNQFDTNISSDAIAGWMAIDEPKTIDNYEPFKMVNDIVQAAGHKMYVSFDSYNITDGKYGNWANSPYYTAKPMQEFSARTGISDYGINAYIYDLPSQSFTANVDNLINNIFPYMPGGFTIQGHSYPGLLKMPTPAEMLYHANLGILYGARELRLYNYFDNGILSGNLYSAIQNYLSPKLKGAFGNTIINSGTNLRMPGISSGSTLNIPNSSGVPQISSISGASADIFDVGVLSSGSENLFYVLPRPYNSSGYCTINFNNLNGYVNWRVKKYSDVINYDNFAVTGATYNYNSSISSGNAELFSIAPVVKEGGTITANETISSATTLNGAMTIATGCTLTINSTYTINNDITLEGTGKIQFGYNGNIVLNNGAKIINSSWSSSLLRGNASQKPKLIWSPYTGSGTVTGYEIYRQFETSNFDYLVSTGANQFSYTDQTITIAPVNMSGPDASYYVKAVFSDDTKSAATNTVSVMVYAQKKKAEKEAVAKSLEFKCDNYPNPFNPTTTISYQIPSAEKVTLKIFDVLGKEIITLVDGYKEADSYHAVFDASKFPSGVYIYRLEAGRFAESKKMIFTK